MGDNVGVGNAGNERNRYKKDKENAPAHQILAPTENPVLRYYALQFLTLPALTLNDPRTDNGPVDTDTYVTV
jgi:hypothetical protein